MHPGAVNEADVPNVVARGFGGRAPRTHICGDLTYVRVGASWNYVCLLVDLCNGEIVGHSAGPGKDARPVKSALGTLFFPISDIEVFHTDRGSEFDNTEIDLMLETFGIERSLSARGRPHDSAVDESTDGILRAELVLRETFGTTRELRTRPRTTCTGTTTSGSTRRWATCLRSSSGKRGCPSRNRPKRCCQSTGEPVSWRALATGDAETPVVASEKVVRRIMREEGLVARKAAQMRRRARYRSYRGELAGRPANVLLRGDGTHDFHAAAPGLFVVTDVTEFRLDGHRAYLSPAIDSFDGWPICWRVSVHADSDLMVGMLRDLVGIVGPTEGRPLTVHTDGGAVYMGREWREACGPGVVRSMSRRARSPDNARAEGFFGTLKCDFFEGRDWTGVPFDEFSRLLGEYIE